MIAIDGNYIIQNFFFFFNKKDVYSKNCYMQKKHKAKPEVQKGGEKKKFNYKGES